LAATTDFEKRLPNELWDQKDEDDTSDPTWLAPCKVGYPDHPEPKKGHTPKHSFRAILLGRQPKFLGPKTQPAGEAQKF
jgi:hypothetical protein